MRTQKMRQLLTKTSIPVSLSQSLPLQRQSNDRFVSECHPNIGMESFIFKFHKFRKMMSFLSRNLAAYTSEKWNTKIPASIMFISILESQKLLDSTTVEKVFNIERICNLTFNWKNWKIFVLRRFQTILDEFHLPLTCRDGLNRDGEEHPDRDENVGESVLHRVRLDELHSMERW